MGKLSLFNKSTQENFNAKIALEILADVLNYLTPYKEEFSEFCMGYHENGPRKTI